MNRNFSRVAALVFFLCLSISPAATAANRKDRDLFTGPGERIVRVVKKIKNIFRGIGSHDEQIPPVPRP